jgi:16S rRNA (cytosine1402-N4)-methyltransferase
LLAIRPGAICLDATINGGGHTEAMLADAGPSGRLLGIDRDPVVLGRVAERLAAFVQAGRLRLVNDSFQNLEALATKNGFTPADAVLFDVGVSSFHFDASGRGFSLAHNEPLDMRFDPSEPGRPTAADLLQSRSAAELTHMFRTLGEERFASRIARSIVARRRTAPVRTSEELSDVVRASLPASVRWRWNRHAARVFQALRILVNDELTAIEAAIPQAIRILRPGGRLVVISFHSLEDRIVKRAFRASRDRGEARLLTRKPVRPDDDEVAANPRSSSALLRALEKTVSH